MHRVTVRFADGHPVRLVLRRYVRLAQIAQDPRVAAHEAAVLRLVERIATPTPQLIDADPTGDLVGDLAGTPAVLMTELPGRPEWSANGGGYVNSPKSSPTSTTSTPSTRAQSDPSPSTHRSRTPAGTPIKVVSERLGHAHPGFTMATYQHLIPGVSATAALDFANMIATATRDEGCR